MAHWGDIENLMDRVSMGFELSFYYKGQPYFISDDGPGPCVRPSINNMGNPIFVLPTDKRVCDILYEFKLDGVPLIDLLTSDDLVIEGIY